MQFEFFAGAGNTSVKIRLELDESLTADANSLIAMSANLARAASHQGAFLVSTLSDLDDNTGGLQRFTAGKAPVELWLASAKAGDLVVMNMDNDMIFVQAGAFLAAADTVDIHVNWQSNQRLFSNQHAVWLNLQGVGSVILAGFGAIYVVDVDGEHWVDAGHVLAFEETLDLTSSQPRQWVRFWNRGRHICRFRGRGKIWCQSHNTAEFAANLSTYLSAEV